MLSVLVTIIMTISMIVIWGSIFYTICSMGKELIESIHESNDKEDE
jgi:hypothetical protein